MCDASTFFESRRAILDEVLVVTKLSGTTFTEPICADVRCACLKTGDRVQFCSLPEFFQRLYSVGANAVAVFRESYHNSRDRDLCDSFDFENTSLVSLSEMPSGVTLNCVEIDGVRSNRPLLKEAPMDDADLVGVSNGVRAGVLVHNVSMSAVVRGAAVLALILGAILTTH